jgi:uncharacterized phage protein (TIGR01671 family)
MREILFRGKRISDGKWLYGSLENHLFRSSADESPITCIFDPGIEPDYHSFECFDNIDCEVDPKTVGQYTGIEIGRKEKTKLFEGDVIQLNTELLLIEFSERHLSFLGIKRKHKTKSRYANWRDGNWLNIVSEYARIVGNRYDDPALIVGIE